MAIKAEQSHVDNFHVIAAFAALEVLQKDDYFQDLPQNWQQIILKIKDKLTSKEQRARFEEKLTDIAHGESPHEAKAALPDAIKHLISALNPNASPQQTVTSAFDGLSRAYTPSGAIVKMPFKKQNCNKELPEEPCSNRMLFIPVN